MTDARALADEAVQYLDRLGAVILDDVGDGPPVADLASAAAAARDAVARLTVPALTQLTGLVAGVATSIAAGGTEWNPSLGGTLMAAVDDLRHLAARASQFTDEDSEHLSHRAAELSVYFRGQTMEEPPPKEPVAEMPAAVPAVAPPPAPAAPTEAADGPIVPIEAADRPIVPIESLFYTDAGTTDKPVVPIAALFYADGPHIISGGIPEAATRKSDLLGRGIDALENLTAKPLAPQTTVGSTAVVPVETLLYKGRAALQRAAAIREQIRSSGGAAAPAALDEMYDLITLALKD